MDTPNFDTFMVTYREELYKAVEQYPGEYAFTRAHAPDVADRMQAAFARGSYNKDGRAIKATCKRLGIIHTYAAINEVLARR